MNVRIVDEDLAIVADADRVQVIDLWPIIAECVVCGADSLNTGIPMYEGDVLPNDWSGEWGGAPACRRCMIAQGRLVDPLPLEIFRIIALPGMRI